ncbi:uncharacterized protein LOC110448979 isoform X1 [Mizuhopecten yessoensis]|uniref:Acyl-CoA synthetase YngI n=1 Tax=Mizuhopecten yessoensis TaxID=6573 RepID=A0A210QS40_MIZYE|nr:uncharacterized protein LOC110448979 isoform X1 [Mizuhopecten yessoensis]OWF51560.1 acyl-CoA synthetase YngI [Mizuhopecten yessoensis]
MAELSYLSCPNPVQLRYKSIIEVLHERANEAPDKQILIQRFEESGRRKSLTYRELVNRSTEVAKYLISRGIVAGDCVAIIGPNSIEWIVGEIAIFLTGAVAVHKNKTSESFGETIKFLEASQSKAVLLDPESDETYISDMEAYVQSEESSHDKPIVLLLQKSTLSSLPSLTDVTLTTDEASISLPRIQPESIAVIVCTSGSTGVPKMVEMTHFAIVNASYLSGIATLGDRTYGTCYNDRPFSWLGGFPIFSIINGNPRVFVDTSIGVKQENAPLIWNIIMDEQCTNAGMLPYALLDLMRNKDIEKHSYKLYCISTGGQMIGSNLTEVCGKLTEKLLMVYGSTELGFVCGMELTSEMEVGHVGSLYPGNEVKIVGDSGETLNRGKLGEILVRSPWMLKSYRNAPELNAASFADGGWFRTGDIGLITENSKLFVKGKATDVIKRGGLKVLTSMVETAMSDLPDVREVVVLAVPDARLLEEVCACYILEDKTKTTDVELDQKCRLALGDNVLGSSPSYFLRFDEFPKLINGKTDKINLKKRVLERLNLN